MKPQIHQTKESLPAGTELVDQLFNISSELFFIENPSFDKKTVDAPATNTLEQASVWAYYPDLKKAVRIPNEDTYQKIRTARNRNLITENEQSTVRSAHIAIAGLSVGSQAFMALVQTGGPKRIKIADPDIIELSNLNRIRANVTDLGANKSRIAAREAWLLDPFLQLELWESGISESTLEKFVAEPRVDVFIDEMDDIRLKILARTVCKKHGIPVVMATDNGDSAIVDVERFDQEPGRPIFHGRVSIQELPERLDRDTFVQLANEIIDPTMFTARQWSSIQEIGKTLSGVPQLASAAMIAGASVAYTVRQIVTKQPLQSGRYILGSDLAFMQQA